MKKAKKCKRHIKKTMKRMKTASGDLGKRWCSWCFAKSAQHLQEHNTFGKNVYKCTSCGNLTVECSFCKNMARTGRVMNDVCCAVHDGSIAKFETLGMKLRDISQWRRITKRDEMNMVKVAKIGGGVAAVALVATGVGAAAAPAIGGMIGSMSGLAGAAATGHGLAVLGGGALAAGGMGMAGGTAVICIGAGLLGSAGGGVLMNRYVSDVEDFNVSRLRSGKGPKVITLNGLMRDDSSVSKSWQAILKARFAKNPWYDVTWEPKRLRTLGELALGGGSKAKFYASVEAAAEYASKQAKPERGRMWAVKELFGLAKDAWWTTVANAEKTGDVLADLMIRTTDRTPFILVGHSFGANVIYRLLAALALSGQSAMVQEVHLLGGAVSNASESWDKVLSAVKDKVFNYYSENDEILRVLYAEGKLFSSFPIGIAPIPTGSEMIVNVDVRTLVSGHEEFRTKAPQFIQKIVKNEDPADAQAESAARCRTRSQASHTVSGYHTMAQIEQGVKKFAPTNASILLLGETGTGKGHYARMIHEKSRRKEKPFVPINCASLPKERIDSELFGHEDGAFTGAKRYEGLIRSADGGTVFLDEIGDLPESCFPNLLHFLEAGPDGMREVRPLGSSKAVRVNVRVLAATNRGQLIRKDVWHRYDKTLTLPPLRMRKQEIPELARQFFSRFRDSENKSSMRFPEDESDKLDTAEYEWPGNVRQLEKAVYQAVIRCERTDGKGHLLLLAEDILQAARENEGMA